MTERPTHVRYAMIALTTLVAVMLYLDRVCLSIVDQRVKLDLNLSKTQFDDLTSAFFWTYALFQLPAGWLGDRFGPRAVLPLYLCLWSICTGLMGFAGGLTALFILRLGCGTFEAGAYPLAAGVVRRWVPAAARGLASGCVAVGGRLGGAAAPTLTIWLAGLTAYDWRGPFVVYGAVGVVIALIYWLGFRDRPEQHPAVNAAEVALIGNTADAKPVGAPPFAGLVTSSALWLTSLVQFLANFAWVFLITLFPTYLSEVFQMPDGQRRAWYQAAPLYAAIGGMLLGGWLSDRTMRSLGPRWGRALPVALSRVVVGAAYLACLGLGDPLAVTVMMCLVAFATDVGVAPVWAYSQDVGGRHVGAVIGWANMWGNFGAAVAPPLLSRLRSSYPDDPMAGWNAAFLLCAATQVLAALAALGIDASKPIRGTDR